MMNLMSTYTVEMLIMFCFVDRMLNVVDEDRSFIDETCKCSFGSSKLWCFGSKQKSPRFLQGFYFVFY